MFEAIRKGIDNFVAIKLNAQKSVSRRKKKF